MFALPRNVFENILGPLEELMNRCVVVSLRNPGCCDIVTHARLFQRVCS